MMGSFDQTDDRPSGQSRLSLSLNYDRDDFVVEVFGELDVAGAPELQQVLDRAEATEAKRIVVDLSGLEFIDSTGISVLVKAARRSSMNAGRLRLLRGAGQVERVMALCRLHERLPFAD